VETFISLKLNIDNWRWAGVPFYLRTGKHLAQHETFIVIQFRRVPVQMFRDIAGGGMDPNLLTIQIYPREEIALSFAAKIPGTTVRLGGVSMKFDYEQAFGTLPKTGYESLIYDAMMGDRTLFQRADQIEAQWEVIEPILKSWKNSQTPRFPNYQQGSWGPQEAQALLARDGRYWRELESPPPLTPQAIKKPKKRRTRSTRTAPRKAA
jgi:glucose-6-phosphate 1-dehydrogenase